MCEVKDVAHNDKPSEMISHTSAPLSSEYFTIFQLIVSSSRQLLPARKPPLLENLRALSFQHQTAD